MCIRDRLLQVISRDWGLSPCIRGSLAAGHVDTDGLGFIPVHTGEPTNEVLPSGDLAVSFQMVSIILLGPGSSFTHDALRLSGSGHCDTPVTAYC